MVRTVAAILLICTAAYAGDENLFSDLGTTPDGRQIVEPEPYTEPEQAPIDTDGDGTPDKFDPCPNDPTNTCNNPPPSPDRDGDGIPDTTDTCPDDPLNQCNVHPEDEGKHAEHIAALNLVPIAEATHTLKSGTLPTLPDGAMVYIPEGVTVTVNREHTERIRWLRVNGTLVFARNKTIALNCDTCVVDASGWIDSGTVESPRTAALEWTFIDNGPVSDPMQLGRGIVCHGRFDCTCAEGVEVTIRSENKERLHRGHFMQMHKAAFTADGLRLVDCGRTDKSVPVTDFPDVANQRGRYPLHFHRCGLTTPMQVRRATVEGSPGWGIVNHESNVECDDSICRDTFGAGFVGEVGFERGWFRNCLAEDIPGTGKDQTAQVSRVSLAHNDWGHAGHGVWIQGGGGILVEGCVVRRCAHSGIITMGDTPQNGETFRPINDVIDAAIFPKLAEGSIWFWPGSIMPSAVPVRIRNNTISECGKAGIEFWNNQNPNGHNYERGDISGNLLVGCGMISGYSNRLDVRRNKIIGDAAKPLAGPAYGHTGFGVDIAFDENEVTGWTIGYFGPTDGELCTIKDNTFANVIDCYIEGRISNNPQKRVLDISGNTFGPIGFDPMAYFPISLTSLASPGRYHVALLPTHPWFDIRNYLKPNPQWETVLFDVDTTFEDDHITLDGRPLIFPEWCSDYSLPAAIPSELRLKADGSVKTSGEWAAEGNKPLFGRVPVSEWQSVPNVRGRLAK